MEILDRERIDAETLEALDRAVAGLRTLGDLLDWSRSLPLPVLAPDVVTQDEYTHDVLVPWRASLVLAFDTT